MEPRRWPMVLMTLLLIALIYNFLNTIFKSDIKRFSHDRIYVDYGTYKKTSTTVTDGYTSSRSPIFQRKLATARETIHEGRMEAAVDSYQGFMSSALQNMKNQPPDVIKPRKVQEYEDLRQLAAQDVPGLSEGKVEYAAGHFDVALARFLEILETLPANDLHHRSQICDNIAECHFRMGNRAGYVEYKVKYVTLMRQTREIMVKAYPQLVAEGIGGWITSEEATQQLLRLRTIAEKLKEPERTNLVMRAELDREVSLQLNR